MAFGGVATGIMKAQLAAMAAGTVNSNGEMSWATAKWPKGLELAADHFAAVVSATNTKIDPGQPPPHQQ